MLYHVELEGRTVGPYDRRTIVGMCIKKTLAGAHVVIGPTGARTTVADLIRSPSDFNPSRTSVSVVHATFTAGLVEVVGPGMAIPRFRGEMEARVQKDVLRLAGRFRHGFGWKEDRVKIPIGEIVHARARGSLLDLGLRTGRGAVQRITLELFSAQAAMEFLGWLPDVTAFPEPPKKTAARAAQLPIGMIVAVLGVVVTLGLVLAVLLLRRTF